MMAAGSLHLSVHFIVPSGVSFHWSSPCRCGCSPGADPAYRAPHFAQPPAPSSYVQASCLERARPVAVAAFAGGLAASSAAPPGRRRPERKRRAKAEGKIEGSGTLPVHKRVCTWGWRGTRYWTAPCRDVCQSLVGIGETACMTRPGQMALAGVSA